MHPFSKLCFGAILLVLVLIGSVISKEEQSSSELLINRFRRDFNGREDQCRRFERHCHSHKDQCRRERDCGRRENCCFDGCRRVCERDDRGRDGGHRF